MYANPQKFAQELMKPIVDLASNNTTIAVKMIGRSADMATKQLEGNLAHLQALASADDVNKVVQLQKDYVKAATEDFQSELAASVKLVQEAAMELNKAAQDSWNDVKEQMQETVRAAK